MPKYLSQPHDTVEVFVNGFASIAFKAKDDFGEELLIAFSVQQAQWLLQDLPALIEQAKACAQQNLYVGDEDAEPSNP